MIVMKRGHKIFLLFLLSVIGFILYIVIARYQVKHDMEETNYQLGVIAIDNIAEKIKRERKVTSLYNLYVNSEFPWVQKYVSAFNREKYNKAICFDSMGSGRNSKGGRFIIKEEEFDKLCSYIVRSEGNRIIIYDKYNPKVRREFELPRELEQGEIGHSEEEQNRQR